MGAGVTLGAGVTVGGGGTMTISTGAGLVSTTMAAAASTAPISPTVASRKAQSEHPGWSVLCVVTVFTQINVYQRQQEYNETASLLETKKPPPKRGLE
jgi:invasion protein IalB